MRVGMAAPLGATWDERIKQTGPVDAQRIFAQSDAKLDVVEQALREGRTPIVSYKFAWAGVTSGSSDRALGAIADGLQALAVKYKMDVYATVHHEPSGDGNAQDYAAMQVRANRVMRRPNVKTGPIVNGFWWGERGGLDDAALATWLPKALIDAADFVAADFYESDRNKNADVLKRFVAWADRVGAKILGIGEIGTYEVTELIRAKDYLLSQHKRFAFACWFNSERNSRADWVLAGDRLVAFKQFVQQARALDDPEEPPVDPPVDPPTDPKDVEIADLKRQLALALEAGDRADQVADEQRARAEAAETRAAGLQAEKNALTDERDRLVGAVRNMVQLGSSVLPA